jgi:hypothetical protein
VPHVVLFSVLSVLQLFCYKEIPSFLSSATSFALVMWLSLAFISMHSHGADGRYTERNTVQGLLRMHTLSLINWCGVGSASSVGV